MSSTTKLPTPAADRAEILRALRLLGPPDAVREIRVFDTPRDGTVSGYFNNPELLAHEAEKWNGKAPGVYVTLNQLPRSAIARRANRTEPRIKSATTDKDISRLLWFLLDMDPSRLRGTSSTNEEHALALARTREIVRWLLDELAWPAPILGDSGNGGHGLWRIDLPNDDASEKLIQRGLRALAARFDDERLAVDQTVFNAARICKLYGTAAAKGDNLEEWPHRLARILAVPDPIEVVSVECLEALAKLAPDDAKKGASKKGNATFGRPGESVEASKEWIEDFIKRYNITAEDAKPWEGGFLWVLPECYWDRGHANRSAYITVGSDGKFGAGCHHNGCRDNNWSAFRGLFETAHRNGKTPPHGDEDAPPPPRSGGLTGDWKAPEPEPAEPPPDEPEPEPFPLEALPEPLARFVREESAAMPCPPDLIALPMLAVLGGAVGNTRELEVKRGWREGPRIYVAAVARAGEMKTPALNRAAVPMKERQAELAAEHRRALADYEEALARHAVEMQQWKKDAAKSANVGVPPEKPERPAMARTFTDDATMEALGRRLNENPRGVVFMRDEITGWVASLNQYRAGKGADRQRWLSIWSGETLVIDRVKDPDPLIIPRPFANVCGCIPPDMLGELEDERGREDGFLHRILFGYPSPIPLEWTEATASAEALDGYRRIYAALCQLRGEEDEDGNLLAVTVHFTPDGKAEWERWIRSHYAEESDPDLGDFLRGPWAKMRGYCARLALLLQLCRAAAGEAESESVEAVSVLGAAALIDYFKSHIRRVYARLHASPEEVRAARAVEWLKKHGGRASIRDLLRGKVGGTRRSEDAVTLMRDLAGRGYGAVEGGKRRDQLTFTLQGVSTVVLGGVSTIGDSCPGAAGSNGTGAAA
jgi:hypothetical protein